MTTPNRSLRPNAPETKSAVMKRRALLLQVLNQHAAESPTYEKLAELMLENKYVEDNWPGYNASAAWKDFDHVSAILEKDNRELATLYFDKQLALTEQITATLLELVLDEEQTPKVRIDAAKAIRGNSDQIIRMFGNYAPKETYSKTEMITATIEDMYRLEKEAREQLEAGVEVIDGETA